MFLTSYPQFSLNTLQNKVAELRLRRQQLVIDNKRKVSAYLKVVSEKKVKAQKKQKFASPELESIFNSLPLEVQNALKH